MADMDYAPFKDMENVDSMFKTSRGSTYAHLDDGTTIRNRSGANHSALGVQKDLGLIMERKEQFYTV